MEASKLIIQVLSNTDFSVNYQDNTLSPKVELILLTQQRGYDTNSKGMIKKTWKVEEARFQLLPKDIDQLIGQLQNLSVGIKHYEHLAASINALVRHSAEEQGRKKSEERGGHDGGQ